MSKLEELIVKLESFYDGRLAIRVKELVKVLEEEGDPVLSISSLQQFVAFIAEKIPQDYPMIIVTLDGNIRAKISSGILEFIGD